MANVDQYLLMADSVNGSDRWVASQLSSKLRSSRRGEEAISTTDSGPSPAKARGTNLRIQPKASEGTSVPEAAAGDVNARPRSPTEDTRLQSGSRQVRSDAASNDKKATEKKEDSAADSNQSADITHMWRPW